MSNFWQEGAEDHTATNTPENVFDALFRLKGSVIHVDHAWYLAQELARILPWFASVEVNAMHLIHVAQSGNGWQRPDDSNGLLHLSNRTRLRLRVAKECLHDVEALVGETLKLPSGPIDIGASTLKPLLRSKVLFARYVIMADCENENDFLESAWAALKARGISTKKMLCGRQHSFTTPQGDLFPRSLMVADLDSDESIQLQEMSLGEYRTLGCGIFMPHKGIDAVGDRQK